MKNDDLVALMTPPNGSKRKVEKLEEKTQCALIKWFTLKYPTLRPLLTLASIGENVGPRRMKRLKQMGLTPGYPDLFLAIPTPEFHGLFIEMKTKTGKVQKNQLAIHKMLMSVHFAVCVCYDWMEAMQVIEGYLEGLPIKLLA